MIYGGAVRGLRNGFNGHASKVRVTRLRWWIVSAGPHDRLRRMEPRNFLKLGSAFAERRGLWLR